MTSLSIDRDGSKRYVEASKTGQYDPVHELALIHPALAITVHPLKPSSVDEPEMGEGERVQTIQTSYVQSKRCGETKQKKGTATSRIYDHEQRMRRRTGNFLSFFLSQLKRNRNPTIGRYDWKPMRS
ncbi:hypothetical protein PHLCEN_2v11856 [Hermanssonia centrifuga]|uniref:Uncharacterized protein n=1 Tax=Hermanssonia centrifuga TaxID=98765 RepID=A0A2R6NIS1_9APHY|nr:hypothetical protein PHLCEN_2v11856 [Hermanssonia centrifuga]